MSAVKRPVMRYHGGKWKLAPWIISHFPRHRVYVEPFGGAASVLLRKGRVYAEVYNDLDGDLVNLFRILRSDQAGAFIRALENTPFARDEFEEAYHVADSPLEEARRLVIRSMMGFGTDGFNRAVRTGFRSNSCRSGTTPARDWMNYPTVLPSIVERLRGVVIENRPAVDVMSAHDGVETLHYVDPPYLPETRSDKSRNSGGKYHAYRHEMSVEDHAHLLAFVNTLLGMVVISGYPSEVYDAALSGWTRVSCDALADGARERTEVLWLNAAASERIQSELQFGGFQ